MISLTRIDREKPASDACLYYLFYCLRKEDGDRLNETFQA